MSERTPKVSIVMPVYNGANYMREAIDSALAQTYPNIEIILVNDGSTDGGQTEEIALSYGDRIRYFHQENGGQSSALNYGIREMTGEYFSWLSHDDVYCRDKTQVQVDYMREHDDWDVVLYSDFENIDKNSEVVHVARDVGTTPDRIRYELMIASPVHGCTLLAPRQALLELGGFDERIPRVSDVDMWFKLAATRRLIHIPKILAQLRTHVEQVSRAHPAFRSECDNLYLSCMRDMDDDELVHSAGASSLAEAYAGLAEIFSKRGYRKAYRHALRMAATHAADTRNGSMRLLGPRCHVNYAQKRARAFANLVRMKLSSRY